MLLPATLDLRALLQRWKQYTQLRLAVRLLDEALRRRRFSRVTRVAFDGWQTGLGPKQKRAATAMAFALAEVGTAAVAAPAVAAVVVASTSGAFQFKTKTKSLGVIDIEEDDDVGAVANDEVVAAIEAETERQGLQTMVHHRTRRQQAFDERRAEADLKVVRRNVVAGWKGALARNIKMKQMRQEWRVKKAARRVPT